jgi:hypothetical protein
MFKILKYPNFLLISLLVISSYMPTAAQRFSNFSQPTTRNNAFVENVGQYGKTMEGFTNMGAIQFGYENLGMPILFTAKGLVHLQRKVEKITKEEEEKLEKAGRPEEEIERKKNITDRTITMEWVGANENVQIIKEEKTYDYHTYGLLTEKAYGYKKITYKNLYDGIDVVYSFVNNKLGFEYSLLVQPGADLSKVKMKYGGDVKSITTNAKGNLIVKSDIEGIEETIPVSYYGNTINTKNTSEVKTEYKIVGDEVGFYFPNGYDNTRSLVVDPFINNTSNLTGTYANQATDVDYDYAGNVYVSGGITKNNYPNFNGWYQHAKYSCDGMLQWTFNGQLTTPYWTSGDQRGGWAVDKISGALYLGQGYTHDGTGFKIIRINTSGLYDNYISSWNPSFRENWKIYWSYNNGSPQIICAGGDVVSNNNLGILTAPSTNLIAVANLTGNVSNGQDISDLVIDPVTKSVYTIYGAHYLSIINNRIFKNNSPYNAANIAWNTPSGYTVLEEAANRPYIGSPLVSAYNVFDNSTNVLAQNATYLFYWDGLHLKAFNKSTGAIAGVALTIAGNTALMQGGIVADSCDNVFIGNKNGTIKVYKFNGSSFDDVAAADISILGYAASSVYDLALDESKKLLYASGNGFVTAIDVSIYCNKTIYTLNTLPNCVTSSAIANIVPSLPSVVINYILYIGATPIATNTTGVFTSLLPNTNYTILATINFGCNGLQQITTNFTLPNTPTLVITNPPAVCSPNTVDITTAAIIAGSSAGITLTYWTDAAATTTYPTPAVATAGTYYIKATNASGCFDIKPVVVANTLVSPVIAGPATVCQTLGTYYTTYSTANVAGHTYTWAIAGGTILTGQGTNSITVDWTTVGTGNVSVTETIANTICNAIDSKLVTINPKPNTAAISHY